MSPRLLPHRIAEQNIRSPGQRHQHHERGYIAASSCGATRKAGYRGPSQRMLLGPPVQRICGRQPLGIVWRLQHRCQPICGPLGYPGGWALSKVNRRYGVAVGRMAGRSCYYCGPCGLGEFLRQEPNKFHADSIKSRRYGAQDTGSETNRWLPADLARPVAGVSTVGMCRQVR